MDALYLKCSSGKLFETTGFGCSHKAPFDLHGEMEFSSGEEDRGRWSKVKVCVDFAGLSDIVNVVRLLLILCTGRGIKLVAKNIAARPKFVK